MFIVLFGGPFFLPTLPFAQNDYPSNDTAKYTQLPPPRAAPSLPRRGSLETRVVTLPDRCRFR